MEGEGRNTGKSATKTQISPPCLGLHIPSLCRSNQSSVRASRRAGAASITAAPQAKDQVQGAACLNTVVAEGPAILKLSAWGARELAACDYRFPLRISWTGGTQTEAFDALTYWRNAHPRKQLVNTNPFVMPSRLWERFIAAVPGLSPESQWAGISKDNLQKLAAQAAAADFTVEGKSLNKDEFVTCGGVRLREVDFKTMESRLQPGLHFAGELLDIDGITGGFNFQAAWTTGWLAGQALAAAANASAHHSDA